MRFHTVSFLKISKLPTEDNGNSKGGGGGGGGGSKRTQFSALIEYHSDFLIGDPFCGIIVAAGCFTSRIMAFVKSLALKRGK